MELNMLKNQLMNIKKGTFKSFMYKTELPVKAAFKNSGYQVVKICRMTSRFGINYGNIKSVKEKAATTMNKIERTNNYIWETKNLIQFNNKTGKYYLCTYPTKHGKNVKAIYQIISPEGIIETNRIEDVKDFVIDSYWTKRNNNGEMLKISIDNILSI